MFRIDESNLSYTVAPQRRNRMLAEVIGEMSGNHNQSLDRSLAIVDAAAKSGAHGGVDSTFSMEPAEMAALVVETERAWMALGEVHYGSTEKEQKSQVFCRSLYVAEDQAAGDVLTEDNLRIIHPGFGLAPKNFDNLTGKRVGRAVRCGMPMSWELLISSDDEVVSALPESSTRGVHA